MIVAEKAIGAGEGNKCGVTGCSNIQMVTLYG
jgi:hypothetical protein